MKLRKENVTRTLQRFEPDPDATYPLDIAAHLAHMPRHDVLLCCKHRLVIPRIDATYGGYSFDLKAIRTLQHIQYLRADCGINFTECHADLHPWAAPLICGKVASDVVGALHEGA